MSEPDAKNVRTSEPSAWVVFTPSGKRGRFPLGTPLLQAARSLGVDVDSVCGGRALCGRCQVLVMEGDFPKHGVTSQAANLSPLSAAEQSFARRRTLPAGHRLSCSAHIQGNLVVDVPPSSQVHRQVVRKAADARPITLDPVVHLHYVEVREPDMHGPSGDLQRLLEALHREWEFGPLRCDLAVLQTLQAALRKGQWKVTVAVHAGSQLIGVWPGFHDRIYGLAVDVGSTTIAAHLCNLETGEVVAAAGSMNPQIRFGEDLMSRVSYSMMHPGGAQQMTEAVRAALNKLAAEVARDAKVSVSDILELTMVGNPIMHHLLLGIDPVELGGAPFALATDSPLDLRAAELGLTLHPGARVYTLPCIAGHVGADAAAMILAERPDLSEKLTLLVDVGTNAEIVLGNRQRLLACSSPTGPAFEGAQISCGQRAAPGAIERVRIDPATLEPIADGHSGELILTNLGRTGSPVSRYRTGNVVVRRILVLVPNDLARAARRPVAAQRFDRLVRLGPHPEGVARTDDRRPAHGVARAPARLHHAHPARTRGSPEPARDVPSRHDRPGSDR